VIAPARGLLPLAVLLIGWQLVGDPGSVTVPPPTEWFAALARLHARGELLPAVWSTTSTYLLALGLAVLVGAAVGVAIGASRLADRLLTPSLDAIATVPGAALVPVVILLLGLTQAANVLVVVLVVVWPILLNMTAAMRAVPAVRLDMSRTLGISAAARWRKIILPSLVPELLVGVRISSSLALIITLLGDILGSAGGIGIQLEVRSASFDAAGAWGLLLIVGAIGYLASRAITALERRVLRTWPPGSGAPTTRPAARTRR
jgi:ABC-type nitrate/sulfonate/bicarbonate transport system permease component